MLASSPKGKLLENIKKLYTPGVVIQSLIKPGKTYTITDDPFIYKESVVQPGTKKKFKFAVLQNSHLISYYGKDGRISASIVMKDKKDYKYKIGDIVKWNYGGRSGVSTILGYAPHEDYKYYVVGPPQDKKSSDPYLPREAIDDSGKPITIPHGWNVEESFMQLQICDTCDIKSFKDLKYKIGDQVVYLGKVHTIVAYYADPASKVPPGYTISGYHGIHNGIGFSYDAQGNFIHSGLPDLLCRYVNEEDVTPLTSTTSNTISKSFKHLKYKIGDTVLYCNEPHTIVAYYKGQNIGYTLSGPKGYHDANDYSYDALGNKATLKGFTHVYVPEDRVFPLTSTPTESSLKVGDKVRVKSLDWYNANKDSAGRVPVQYGFVPDMCKYCGKEGTITNMDGDLLHISFQNCEDLWRWSREMLDLGSSSVIKCKTKTQKPAIHNIYTPNQTILKTKKHVNSKIVH